MSIPEEIERKERHWEAQMIDRTLSEYTTVLYEIAAKLGQYWESLGSPGPSRSGPPMPFPREHYIRICRAQSIASDIEILTQTASQMLVHYDLGPVVNSELALRLKDAELALRFAVTSAQTLTQALGHPYPMNLPPPLLPTPPTVLQGRWPDRPRA